MCGIIAVLRRRSDRVPPTTAELISLLEGAAVDIGSASDDDLLGVLDAWASVVHRQLDA